MNVVWLKRDLRLRDHRPLLEAARRGKVLVLYVYEPLVWQAPEADVSQLNFVNESLRELDHQLGQLGGGIVYRSGDFLTILNRLHAEQPIRKLWSHEETGTMATYQRDIAVKRWCRQQGVEWHEFPQTGVVRKLTCRDGWAAMWQQRMDEPIANPPAQIEFISDIEPERIRSAHDLMMRSVVDKQRQPGGESHAHEILHDFLYRRGWDYQKGMSSPVSAVEACSRLSPYIAWGCISIKQIHQKLGNRQVELKSIRNGGQSFEADSHTPTQWLKALNSFQGRLRWHCHFMQKMEDEPELEFQNLCRAYDGLRENDWDEGRYQAWCEGRTGYPMVDACMRATIATGWLNFRMRAMLVSFAANHLWLHWRQPALFLAQHFLDFEPGIHYSQFQMQSGTTGINTLRMYSPAKQVKDHDPTGIFIRRWVPELSEVPDKFLAEPHLMPTGLQLMVGCQIGKDYPAPIVEHSEALKLAKQRLYSLRQTPEAKDAAAAVAEKHGSRRSPNDRQARTRRRSSR